MDTPIVEQAPEFAETQPTPESCTTTLGYGALCAACPLVDMFGDCPKAIRGEVPALAPDQPATENFTIPTIDDWIVRVEANNEPTQETTYYRELLDDDNVEVVVAKPAPAPETKQPKEVTLPEKATPKPKSTKRAAKIKAEPAPQDLDEAPPSPEEPVTATEVPEEPPILELEHQEIAEESPVLEAPEMPKEQSPVIAEPAPLPPQNEPVRPINEPEPAPEITEAQPEPEQEQAETLPPAPLEEPAPQPQAKIAPPAPEKIPITPVESAQPTLYAAPVEIAPIAATFEPEPQSIAVEVLEEEPVDETEPDLYTKPLNPRRGEEEVDSGTTYATEAHEELTPPREDEEPPRPEHIRGAAYSLGKRSLQDRTLQFLGIYSIKNLALGY